MNDKHLLEELRKIAFHFRVKPIGTTGHAVRVADMLHAVAGIQESFKNFMRIEALKNKALKVRFQPYPKLLDAFIEQVPLLMVDVKYGSFEVALAPDLSQKQSPLFKDEVLDWKKAAFGEFKTEVLGGDYNDIAYIKKVGEHYSAAEKSAIYTPLFKAAGSGEFYRAEVWNEAFHKKILLPASPENLEYYKAPKVRRPVPDYEVHQAYVTVREQTPGSKITKKDIGNVIYSEPMEYEVFPYVLDTIQYNDKIYSLRGRLKSTVDFEEDTYFISNEKLGIEVWGSTRDEAEEAFKFTFDALYLNYATEADENLTEGAQKLKAELNNVVLKVHAA